MHALYLGSRSLVHIQEIKVCRLAISSKNLTKMRHGPAHFKVIVTEKRLSCNPGFKLTLDVVAR